MKVTLRLRDLKNGEGKHLELDDLDAAAAWLKGRPPFVDVLGVVFEGLTHEDNDRLKAAMRPLDAEELAAERLVNAQEAKLRSEKAAREQQELEAQTARDREEAKTADPNRPMEVAFHYKEGLRAAEALDDREISTEARDAVMAWVAERNEWVEGRGQMIGEAKVRVWPGPVPGGADRVLGGTFVPVTK
jgi:hypothetical protein